jgi:threonine dehydrogenase-like Zn-dependent dehydrogenase
VPGTCSDDAAAMAQPHAVALHALRRSGAAPGQSIAVIGAGGIGSFLVGAAAATDAGLLIAVDIDDGRLEAARALGATHIVHAGREDAVAAIRALTGEGADVVLEASGVPRSPGVAIAAAKRGGTVLIVGLQAEPVPLDLFSATLREVDIKTTLAHVCDEDLAAAVAMLDGTDFARIALAEVIGLSEIVPRGLVPLADGSASGKLVVDVRA